jgi:hypothetical protein
MKNLRFRINDTGFKIKEIRLQIRNLAYLLTLIFYLVILVPSVHAQQPASFPRQYLRVSPIISELKITPGRQTSFDLTIENLSESPLGIHAELSNLLELEESENVSDENSPLISWTKLSENDFIVDAKGERTIKVNINPPKDIREGGYYEVIYFTPFVSGQNQSEKPVVLSRIGALIFVTHGELDYRNLREKVSVASFKPDEFLISKPEVVLDLKVKNNYFTYFTAKPVITVTRIFGGSEKIEIEEKRILSGRQRAWEITQSLKSWGAYKADLVLSVGSGEQIFASTWFLYLPVNPLVPISIFLLLFIAIRGRKRLKKVIRIISGKAGA